MKLKDQKSSKNLFHSALDASQLICMWTRMWFLNSESQNVLQYKCTLITIRHILTCNLTHYSFTDENTNIYARFNLLAQMVKTKTHSL